MDGAVNDLVSTYGQISIEAFQAAFDVLCPETDRIVAGASTDASGGLVEVVGELYNVIEEADLSCDEAKAGFQIHFKGITVTKNSLALGRNPKTRQI